MFKARVYYHLRSPVEDGDTDAGPARAAADAARDQLSGLNETEILTFLRDPAHQCAVVLTTVRSDEIARSVVETKHPCHVVEMKWVTWLC
jgi:hypothetical protein